MMEGVDWMPLAQEEVQWQVFVNTVMELKVHKWREFLD
jgi:hypothetical protein